MTTSNRILTWLQHANGGDDGRALLLEAWEENEHLHGLLRDVVPRALHDAEVTALRAAIERQAATIERQAATIERQEREIRTGRGARVLTRGDGRHA